ncbi:MAG: hypothetical protein JXR66_04815 [Bacteroidales bacterium]|nr:hypothetical protein [Bacteroidales bacterium]
MKTLKVLKYIGFGILGTGFLFLVIWGVMALWNCLIPDIFNGPELTYWQTFGLFFLSKILLTGIAPQGGHDKRTKKEWRSKFREKFGPYRSDEETEPVAPEA